MFTALSQKTKCSFFIFYCTCPFLDRILAGTFVKLLIRQITKYEQITKIYQINVFLCLKHFNAFPMSLEISRFRVILVVCFTSNPPLHLENPGSVFIARFISIQIIA